MTEQLTVFVQLPGDVSVDPERLADEIRALESVTDVVAREEEPTRTGLEVIQEVTLTITALGGAVAATGVLIDQIRAVLAKIGAKRAQVETADGLSEISVGGAPSSENPAQ